MIFLSTDILLAFGIIAIFFLLVSNYIWYKSSRDLNYTTSLISSYIVFASLIVNCIIWTMFTMNFVEMHINTPFRLF